MLHLQARKDHREYDPNGPTTEVYDSNPAKNLI